MATPAQVRAKLWQGGILASMDWVAACVEWLAADQPGLTREQVVLEVQQQWLDTDITAAGVMDRPVLPADLAAARVVHLPGNYVVMVEQATDVGSPAYGQLQKLHQVDVENARVGEEEGATQGQLATQATQGGRHQAAWEPRPSRALSLALTDGSQRVRGLEEAPLPQLPDFPRPGTKLVLQGPITARRGVILLQPHQVRVLGGEVEELVEQHTPKSVLEARLGTKDVGQVSRFADAPTGQAGDGGQGQDRPAGSGAPQQSIKQEPAARQNYQDQQPSNWQNNGPGQNQQNHHQQQQNQQSQNQQNLLRSQNSNWVGNQQQQNQNQPRQQNQQFFHQDVGDFPDDRDFLDVQDFPDDEADFPPLSPPPVGFPEPSLPAAASTATDFPEDDMEDEELLLAASQAELASPPSTSSLTPPASSVFLSPSRPTAAVQPLAARRPAAGSSPPDHCSRPARAPSPVSRAGWRGEEAAREEEVAQAVAREPWTYLTLLLPRLRAGVGFTAKVKVVSATLASKIALRKTAAGPAWNLAIVINDGTESVVAALAPALLDLHLGPAAEYKTSSKEAFKERSKEMSVMLARLSSVVTLEALAGDTATLTILKMEAVNGLHLAQMRRRRLAA